MFKKSPIVRSADIGYGHVKWTEGRDSDGNIIADSFASLERSSLSPLRASASAAPVPTASAAAPPSSMAFMSGPPPNHGSAPGPV